MSIPDKTVEFVHGVWADGFTMIPNYLLHHPDMSPAAKLTWAGLASYAWKTEECWPGQDTLALELGLGKTRLKEAIKELENSDLVIVTRRGLGQTNLYRLTTPRESHSDPPDSRIATTNKTKREEDEVKSIRNVRESHSDHQGNVRTGRGL